jgi:hypothetical protein
MPLDSDARRTGTNWDISLRKPNTLKFLFGGVDLETQEFLLLFTGSAGVIVVILRAILSVFLPFMVYSIMKSNKELLELNKKILAEQEHSYEIKTC